MIPVHLIIKGLYSYKEPQEIDFSRLTETAIFGIFGKVGSGKSSILEAITYALYGETDRLNKSGDDRNYNMMNLRSSELLIDYVCRAGAEGHKYRFTVKGRRNSKQFDKVNTFERKAYQWLDELKDWAPLEVDDAAERIVGLSYDNFKRTIIIPQGKFQDFLDLPQAQRTRMMNEIFQLHRYDLADKVKILKNRNDNQLENLAGSLAQLGQTTPEGLEQSRRDLKNAQLLIVDNERALKTLAEGEKNLETLRGLFADKKAAQQKITELATQETDFMARSARLDRYQSCRNTFKLVLDQKKIRTADLARDTNILQKKEKEAAERQQLIEAEQAKLNEILPAYEKRETLKEETEELGWVLKLLQIREDKVDLEDKKLRGQAAALGQKEIINQLLLQKQGIEKSLDDAKAERVDLEVVSQVSDWFAQKNALLKIRETLKEEANQVADEVEKLEMSKIELVTKPIYEGILDETHASSHPAAIRERLDAEKAVFSQHNTKLENELLQLKTQRALQQHAAALQSDEPCPLCGSVHHPAVLSESADLEQDLRVVERRQQELHALAEQFDRAKNQLTDLEKQLDFYEKQKKAIREKWSENKSLLARHDEKFIWADFPKDDEERVKEAFKQAKKQDTLILDLDKKQKQKSQEVDEARKYLEDQIQFALQKIEKDLAARLAETDTYQQQLSRLDMAEFDSQTAEQIKYRIHAQNTAYDKLTADYERLTKQIQTFADQQNVLSGEIASLKSNTQQQAEALGELSENLRNDIAASDFADENEIRTMLNTELDVAREKQQIDAYLLTLNTARATLKTLEEKTEGLRYEAEIHQKLRADLEAKTIRLNDLRKEEGGLANQVKKQEQDLAAQADLRKNKEKLDLRAYDLDTLGKLFKAAGFVSYVSAMHLQNLCNQANARFHKMTRHQLQLELYEPRPAEYDFQVRDLLNEGRTRAVKTLSGGQKFQVALSLALALADQIHNQSHAMHNFFFLDEGFGSLDKDSLSEVFETLQSLRRENRIVGVISHVEELQQEIQNHLKIEMTEQGSVVVPHWG